jgi:hypothetical protein
MQSDSAFWIAAYVPRLDELLSQHGVGAYPVSGQQDLEQRTVFVVGSRRSRVKRHRLARYPTGCWSKRAGGWCGAPLGPGRVRW